LLSKESAGVQFHPEQVVGVGTHGALNDMRPLRNHEVARLPSASRWQKKSKGVVLSRLGKGWNGEGRKVKIFAT